MFRIFKEAKDAFLYSPPNTPPRTAAQSGHVQGVNGEMPRSGEAAARLKDALAGAGGVKVEEERNEEVDEVQRQLNFLVQDKGRLEEYMRVIMALSELQTTLANPTNLTYFIKAKGLQLLNKVLQALAYAPSASPIDQEDAQVKETQRIEGVRLWFSVLDCIETDASGKRAFEILGGYAVLETPLQDAMDPQTTTIQGHLLAYILSSDYTVLQALSPSSISAFEPYPSPIPGISKDLIIRHPDALSLLFTLLQRDAVLEETVYRILLGSGPNLYGLRDRVRGFLEESREGEGRGALKVALLKKTLEAGIRPQDAYSLFKKFIKPALASVPSLSPSLPTQVAEEETEVSSSTKRKNARPQLRLDLSPLTITPQPPAQGQLHTPEPPEAHTEILDPEILDIIRHGMRFRSAARHLFRPGQGAALGIKETGKNWPAASKGYVFYSWVYITKLQSPFTLFGVKGADGKLVLRIRVLENSLIGISVRAAPSSTPAAAAATPATEDPSSSAHTTDAPATETEPETEIVCQSLEALIPHNQWVHLGISARRPKGAPAAEMRIIMNGQRVAHMRVPYPVYDGDVGVEIKDEGEGNEWALGRSMALNEALGDEMALLLHHLGPRYAGNLQDNLGRFLTYDGATSLNIYLSSLAKSTADKIPTNSLLVKSLRHGQALQEDSFFFSTAQSLTASGDVSYSDPCSLDDAISIIGGPAVALRIVELARTESELDSALAVLVHLVKENWSACEELERIRGYDILACLLRPKIGTIVSTQCLKHVLSLLGINMDKPDHAVVHNVAAYRGLALDFELWSKASPEVVSMYLLHFHHLVTTSKFSRFNSLRSFQKLSVVRKLLFALKSQWFDQAALPDVVDVLKVLLVQRWSAEDSIKPVFSYLVSSLCQGPAIPTLANMAPPALQPSTTQYAPSLVFAMAAEVIKSPTRLIKTNKVISLHRLLVIFLSNNPALFTIEPCLAILEACLSTTIGESFSRHFETEGGFALFARVLPLVWTSSLQKTVFDLMMGPHPEQATSLHCAPMLSCLIATVERLLQLATEPDDGSNRQSAGHRRSNTASSVRSLTRSNSQIDSPTISHTGLTSLLKEVMRNYKASLPLRRNMTSRRIEVLLPAFAEFATLSGPSSKMEVTAFQRAAAAELLSTLSTDPKLPPNLVSQLRAVVEQLRSTSEAISPKVPSSSLAFSPASPMNFSSSQFGTSIGSRFAPSSPSALNPSSPCRRRPAAEMGMTRSRSISERRAPLKRVLTGESSLQEGKDKNTAWKMIILSVESTRFGKMTLERKEFKRRVSDIDWPKQRTLLKLECGLWPDESEPLWRLDGSEGPLRMRVRLERIGKSVDSIPQRPLGRQRDAVPQHDELSSAVSRVNAAPWEDPFALALGEAAESAEEGPNNAPSQAPELATVAEDAEADTQSISWAEEETSDKQRRIAKTLQAGDVVEEAHNIVRIVGVDALPGLLIFGKRNLYLVDGLVQAADGEIIDARDAPRDVLSIPSGTLAEIDQSEQQSHRWQYTEIVESNKRAFLFRDVAIELYFADKRNFLIVLKDKKERQSIVQKLSSKNDHRDAISRSIIGNFVLDTVAKAVDKSADQLDNMTKRWQMREISTFAYLQILNQHANRTPNDVTQYPVFPWVLADYDSDFLDLNKLDTFRNLSLPMGALTAERKEMAEERYAQTEMIGETPFQYGTHYSSSMIVCGFLIRQSPFTEIFLALQGGNFDLADRLFSSVGRAWESASRDHRGDVRELIPEFYYNPTFLLNMNHHDFGIKQGSGDRVDDVQLPTWALGNPLLFIHRHREALESDYVARHLPAWIDTVFGYKQRDPASFTCFHPLSYRGAVDLEHIEDESERAASTAIIHNFGQTPVQIFKNAHPARFYSGRTSLPSGVRYGVAEHWQCMMCSILPITETVLPISIIADAPSSELKPSTHAAGRIPVPSHMYLSLHIGLVDKSMRIYATDARSRLVHVSEGTSVQKAMFSGLNLLITADPVGVLAAWRYTISGTGFSRGDVKMVLDARLRGHVDKVNCLASSLAWSIFVSGSQDGTAIVWDTNALRYIRNLRMDCGQPIEHCAIHDASGHILLASKTNLQIFTLNGVSIASAPIKNHESLSSFTFGTASPASVSEVTGGMAFLEREFLKEGPLFAVGVGSKVAFWRCAPGVVGSGEPWTLREIGIFARRGDLVGDVCTAVKFIGETLYAAFKPVVGAPPKARQGALYQWTLPEGPVRYVPDHLAPRCMAENCSRQFGLLEPRRHCGGCGGSFCSSDAQHCDGFEKRYCAPCRLQLAQSLNGSRRTSLDRGLESRRGSLV